jgi:hypothetical protein
MLRLLSAMLDNKSTPSTFTPPMTLDLLMGGTTSRLSVEMLPDDCRAAV